MYFSMDEIGDKNIEKLSKLTKLCDKWQLIDRVAKNTGFEGIQVTNSSIYKKYEIPLDKLPEHIKKFRLTYHVGGLYDLSLDSEAEHFAREIENGLFSAIENHMEDVSLHPPFLPYERHTYRNEVRGKFSEILETWIPKFYREGITLSVETHVGGNVFLFNCLEEFSEYIAEYGHLGVLIDVSHNFNDGRTIHEILRITECLKITGLHLSDAVSGEEVKKGTHLPVGCGTIDFSDFLKPFANKNLYGALEIISTSANIKESLRRLKEHVNIRS